MDDMGRNPDETLLKAQSQQLTRKAVERRTRPGWKPKWKKWSNCIEAWEGGSLLRCLRLMQFGQKL